MNEPRSLFEQWRVGRSALTFESWLVKHIKELQARLDVVKEIAIDMDDEEDYWKERLFAALEKPV